MNNPWQSIMKALFGRCRHLRPRHGRVCVFFMLRWGVTLGLCAAMLVAALLLRLHEAPYRLDRYLPTLQRIASPAGFRVKLQHLVLDYQGSLRLVGTGFEVTDRSGDPMLRADKVGGVLSNHRLFLAQLVFKKIAVEGPTLNVTVEPDRITLGKVAFPLAQNADHKGFDLIAFLNNPPDVPQYALLKTISVTGLNATVDIAQPKLKGRWLVQDADVFFSKYFRHGEHMTTTATVRTPEGQPSAIVGSIIHGTQADEAFVRLRFDNANMSLFDPLIPQKVRDILQAPASVELRAKLQENNHFESPQFTFHFDAGRINLPQLYSRPHLFREANLTGSFDQKDGNTLNISRFDLLDQNDMRLLLHGTISGLQKGGDLACDLQAEIEPTTLDTLENYLPDVVMEPTTAWIHHAVATAQTHVNNISLAFKGRIADLPFIDGAQADSKALIQLRFSFADMDATPLPSLPTMHGLKGDFVMHDNAIHIAVTDGTVGKQKIGKADVSIVNMMIHHQEAYLKINTSVSGPTADALAMVGSLAELKPGDIPHVDGTQVSTVYVGVPLEHEASLPEIDLKVSSSLAGINVMVPGLDMPFKSGLGAVVATNSHLAFKAQGTLGDYATNLLWQEDMQHFGKKTEVAGTVTLSADQFNHFLEPAGISVPNKDVAAQVDVQRTPAGFKYILDADLSPNTINWAELNWHKPVGKPARLASSGSFNPDTGLVDVQAAKLKAADADISGHVQLNTRKAWQSLDAAFPRFVLGRTHARVQVHQQKITIKGKSLDLSTMGQGKNSHDEDNFPKTASLDVLLGRLILPDGPISALTLNLERQNGDWTDGTIRGATAHGKLALDIRTADDGGAPLLTMTATDAGEALHNLGFYPDLRKGTMAVSMRLTKQYGPLAFDGQGSLRINQVYLIKAPVLARLLSLLSLEQLLKTGKGIYFDAVEVPIDIRNQVMHISRAEMTGPSLGLTGKGTIDLKKRAIKMDGTLVPVEGLNRMVGNIPLVGPLITGSQGALLAADFKVGGTIEKPDVSVNPLSLVTPGLLKDLFGALFNSKK